jgi:hypothetical protein
VVPSPLPTRNVYRWYIIRQLSDRLLEQVFFTQRIWPPPADSPQQKKFQVSLMYLAPSGSGAKYQGRNESLWEHGGEVVAGAIIAWVGNPFVRMVYFGATIYTVMEETEYNLKSLPV